MSSKFLQGIKIGLVIIVAGFLGLFYFHLGPFSAFKPCAQPITYSLGTFDQKFGISKDQFLADIDQAVGIWDTPINKELFQYSADGKLKINLVYDYRQEATDKLKSLGLTIDDSESSYNSLKARYELLKNDYDNRAQSLETSINIFKKQQSAYEQSVNYWNAQGGADKQTVQNLNKIRDQLAASAIHITKEQNEINSIVDNINALANTLNRIGLELNKDVSMYNTVGQSRGGEFEEGLFISDKIGQRIDIYEFDTQDKLARVLAHELGHALGLEHIDSNPEAIMYRLNQGKNAKLTADDILALNKVCGIK